MTPVELLHDAHDLLDSALGDTDFNTFETEEEEREYAPIQVAARLVMQAIGALSSSLNQVAYMYYRHDQPNGILSRYAAQDLIDDGFEEVVLYRKT